MTTDQTFDREQVRTWIEQATGEGVSVEDALPDTLASTAQALGMVPTELRLWIFDHGATTILGEPAGAVRAPSTWTTADLAAWARRHGLARNKGAA